MIIESLIYIVAYYLFAGLSTYVYAVFKNWEFTQMWNFQINDSVVAGLLRCPRWLVFWIEWIIKTIGGVINGFRQK